MLESRRAPPVSFFEAIDGSTLDPSPDLQRIFGLNDFYGSRGVIGCALSHIGVWKQLVQDSSADNYIVMEDDLVWEDDAIDFLTDRALDISAQSLVFLSYIQQITRPAKTIHHTLVPLDTYNYLGGTEFYSINKAAAQLLLDYIDVHGVRHGIDLVLGICSQLRPMAVEPPLGC
jgi:glycosyl transferase family 25